MSDAPMKVYRDWAGPGGYLRYSNAVTGRAIIRQPFYNSKPNLWITARDSWFRGQGFALTDIIWFWGDKPVPLPITVGALMGRDDHFFYHE
jgi:hypothetical protein